MNRLALYLLVVLASSRLLAQHITVDITPSHALNAIGGFYVDT